MDRKHRFSYLLFFLIAGISVSSCTLAKMLRDGQEAVARLTVVVPTPDQSIVSPVPRPTEIVSRSTLIGVTPVPTIAAVALPTAVAKAPTLTPMPPPSPTPTAIAPSLVITLNMELVTEGFTHPVFLTHAGDERLFVVEREGVIKLVDAGQVVETPFLDISERVGSGASEQGLLSVAFHPDYGQNGRFFVDYTDDDGDTVVAEFQVGADPNYADESSEQIILQVEQPHGNHNGGSLLFGGDGYLYIGLGDGGSADDPHEHGQDRTTLLGTILRLDIDGKQPYVIPVDNPYVDDAEFRPEIWLWGLRNPWRFSFDRVTDDIFIADVGQYEWEEINFKRAGTAGGDNYGWNTYEGLHCSTDGCDSAETKLPIIEYAHENGNCSITGGYIYRGTQVAALWGNYLYSDYCSGNIWAALPSATGIWETQLVAEMGLNVSSFGEDVNGELYVIGYDGSIWKIISAE